MFSLFVSAMLGIGMGLAHIWYRTFRNHKPKKSVKRGEVMGVVHKTGIYCGDDPLLFGFTAQLQIRNWKSSPLCMPGQTCDAQFDKVNGRNPEDIDDLPKGAEKYLFDWHQFELADFRIVSEDE